jgi:hypothetical protein
MRDNALAPCTKVCTCCIGYLCTRTSAVQYSTGICTPESNYTLMGVSLAKTRPHGAQMPITANQSAVMTSPCHTTSPPWTRKSWDRKRSANQLPRPRVPQSHPQSHWGLAVRGIFHGTITVTVCHNRNRKTSTLLGSWTLGPMPRPVVPTAQRHPFKFHHLWLS